MLSVVAVVAVVAVAAVVAYRLKRFFCHHCLFLPLIRL